MKNTINEEKRTLIMKNERYCIDSCKINDYLRIQTQNIIITNRFNAKKRLNIKK